MEYPSQENYSSSEYQADFDYTPWAIRHGFSHAGLALIWIVVAFVAFQVFAGLAVFVVLMIGMVGDAEGLASTNVMDMMSQHMDVIFFANSGGQILFLGLATWFFCRLHVTKENRADFLRLKTPSNIPAMIGVVVVLIIVAQPAIWFLGWINTFIPVPEGMKNMQLQQMDMIETYLTGDGLVLIALFNIGVVPAVCEEILFRGYVQRCFEKSWGVWAAILISGIIFGAYHLQLSNLLPLSAIGILLAYITWTTQSLYPAMVAHFVNNGASVLLGKYYPETAFSELTPESMPPVWMIVASVAISAYLVYILFNNKNDKSASTNPINI